MQVKKYATQCFSQLKKAKGKLAMRHLPSDKYNVAWFKLAEFVTRGEKERALGLYRLLIHSFDDKALAAQLEGDILLSFSDEAAVEKYMLAADLYSKEGKITEASLVHEHILLLKTDADYSMRKLLDFYEQKGNQSRLTEVLAMVSKVWIGKKNYEELSTTLVRFKSSLKPSMLSKVYEVIVIDFCKDKSIEKAIIIPYLEEALNLCTNNDELIQKLMESIKALREDVYQEACKYLKKEALV